MTKAFTASAYWPGRHQTACKIAPVSSPCAPCDALAQPDTKLEAQEDGAEPQWAHLPVIEQVLQCIAAGDSAGRSKDKFAVAAVCKSWRAAAQDVFFSNTWQQPSAAFTHPRQLYTLCPLSKAMRLGDLGHIKCFIKRELANHTKYLLYQGSDFTNRGSSRFLLAALQEFGGRSFTIFMDQYCTGKPIARLSGNLMGTGYDLVACLGSSSSGGGSSSDVLAVMLHVGYKLRMRGMMLPRRMNAIIPGPQHRQQMQRQQMHRQQQQQLQQQQLHYLHNKSPHWNDALRCWCLNFRGRVKLASVKNFQLGTDANRQFAAAEQQQQQQQQWLKYSGSNLVRDSSSSSRSLISNSSSSSGSSTAGLPGSGSNEISATTTSSSSSSSNSSSSSSADPQGEHQLQRLGPLATHTATAAAASSSCLDLPFGSLDVNGIAVQFGKVESDVFISDYDPVLASALQAFAIALTTFGNKVLL